MKLNIVETTAFFAVWYMQEVAVSGARARMVNLCHPMLTIDHQDADFQMVLLNEVLPTLIVGLVILD